MKHLPKILLLSFFLGWLSPAYGENHIQIEPLFPVALKHEFPAGKETFEKVKRLILEHYYSDEVNEDALYWAAIRGMLRHISPPENENLAQIWTPEEYRKILDDLKGEQVSIGIKSSFNAADGSLTVNEILPGSPAESIIMPADRILRVNSQPLKGKSLAELNNILDGPEGTEVVLTINRDIKIYDVTIKRRRFEAENLVASRLSDSTALIELKSFTSGISNKFKEELTKLKERNISKLVIDLRNNQGGVFIESLRIVEFFLPEKSILIRTFHRDTKNQNYISTNHDPYSFETAIIVNGKTASSAEILAGSLRDHQKAFIIGTKTFGKGVIEKTFTLENDFRVKFITGAMYTPKGNSWQGKGLLPDFLVDQDDKTLDSLSRLDIKERLRKDVGLITAVKLLRLQEGE